MVVWERNYENLGDLELNEKKVVEYLVFRTIFAPYTLFKKMTKKIRMSVEDNTPGRDLLTILKDEKPKEPFAVLSSGGVDSGILSKIYDGPDMLHVFVETLVNKRERQFFDLISSTLKGGKESFTFTSETYHEAQKEVFSKVPEPLGDPAIIAVYGAAKYIKEHYPHIRCLVVGEGGDEVFGGYWSYPSIMTFKGEFINMMELIYKHWGLCFLNQYKSDKYIDFVLNSMGVGITEAKSHIEGLMDLDRHLFLPNGVIYKNSIACALNGLACSIPYTHPQIEQFANSLRLNELIDPENTTYFKTKIALKNFALNVGVPEKCVLRDKTGFSSIPDNRVLEWMRQELAADGVTMLGKNWLETSVIWSVWYWCKNTDVGEPHISKQFKRIIDKYGG